MPDKIFVYKKNEVYIHVVSEPHVQKELSENFTFFANNYQWDPRYKARIWDGKIRLYDQRNLSLYAGLYYQVEKFAQKNGYELVDQRNDYAIEFSNLEAKQYIDSLNLTKQERYYQADYFAKAIRDKRITIISPTASGKSLIIYLISRFLTDHGKQKGLIIVPQINLVDQLYSDFAEYGWDSEAVCYKLTGGVGKSSDKLLTISTWQSIYTQPKNYFAQFDFVIGDEAQYFKAASLKKVMTQLVNCDYRVSTTGSLDDTQTNQMVIEGLFGPVIQTVTTKQLIDQGYLSKFQIKCLLLRHTDSNIQAAKKLNYHEEMEWIFNHDKRNEFIANLANSLKGNTLVLVSRIEHGKDMCDMINSKIEKGRKLFFIHGAVSKDMREEIRQILMKEKNGILVATFGTWSVGANLPNLHNIIFAAGAKGRIRNLQSIGRGLRLDKDKEIATLFDVVDDLSSGLHKNFSVKHYLERIKLYGSERFSFKAYKINLKG